MARLLTVLALQALAVLVVLLRTGMTGVIVLKGVDVGVVLILLARRKGELAMGIRTWWW